MVKSVDIFCNGVIDSIVFFIKFMFFNSGVFDINVIMEDVFKVINEIRVVSNGNVVYYVFKGIDIGYLNIYDIYGKVFSFNDMVSVLVGGIQDVQFFMVFDVGKIYVFIKDQFQIKVEWNISVVINVSFSDVEVKIIFDKEVYESGSEYVVVYLVGDYGEIFIEELKVYVIEKVFNQFGEFMEVFEFLVGLVFKCVFMVFYDDIGVRVDIVDKYVFVRIRLVRIQFYKIDYNISCELDKVQYKFFSVLIGMIMFDYDCEVVIGGFDFCEESLGIFKIVFKIISVGKLRYISYEIVLQVISF